MDSRIETAPPAGLSAETGLASRRYGAVNWLGMQTLIQREVQRFLKVAVQTVMAPLVSTVLFMMVFALAFGERPWAGTDRPYVDGLAAGLAMMGILSNAFQNASSSLLIAKVQGNSVDFLMPPLSALELTVAFLTGAAARGLLVGLVSLIAVSPFANIMPENLFLVLWHAIMGSIIFGAMGLIGGVWAEKIDHLAAVTNFVVTPLTFLSGTFYSVSALSEPFATLSHWNPVFYLIDGFRSGFIGQHDASLVLGAAVTGLAAAGLAWACWAILKSGWRLRA